MWCAGALNALGVSSFFLGTSHLPTAIAFAIFSCSPIISVSLGVVVVRELRREPCTTHVLVGLVLLLYAVAITLLVTNALGEPMF